MPALCRFQRGSSRLPGLLSGKTERNQAYAFCIYEIGASHFARQNAGQWNMKDKKYFQPGRISEWTVINFTNERGIDQMLKGLAECCHNRGTPSPPPDHRNVIMVLVGILRQRGIGSSMESGRLPAPRVIQGNPQIVEVSLKTNSAWFLPLTP